MISSKHRISKSHFPTILRNPSISGIYFRAVIAPSLSDKSHFAVIISKKHAKLAVLRNLFRRVVYQLIQENLEKSPVKSMVFIMQKTILHEKSKEGRKNATLQLSDDIKNILDQIIKKYDKNK